MSSFFTNTSKSIKRKKGAKEEARGKRLRKAKTEEMSLSEGEDEEVMADPIDIEAETKNEEEAEEEIAKKKTRKPRKKAEGKPPKGAEEKPSTEAGPGNDEETESADTKQKKKRGRKPKINDEGTELERDDAVKPKKKKELDQPKPDGTLDFFFRPRKSEPKTKETPKTPEETKKPEESDPQKNNDVNNTKDTKEDLSWMPNLKPEDLLLDKDEEEMDFDDEDAPGDYNFCVKKSKDKKKKTMEKKLQNFPPEIEDILPIKKAPKIEENHHEEPKKQELKTEHTKKKERIGSEAADEDGDKSPEREIIYRANKSPNKDEEPPKKKRDKSAEVLQEAGNKEAKEIDDAQEQDQEEIQVKMETKQKALASKERREKAMRTDATAGEKEVPAAKKEKSEQEMYDVTEEDEYLPIKAVKKETTQTDTSTKQGQPKIQTEKEKPKQADTFREQDHLAVPEEKGKVPQIKTEDKPHEVAEKKAEGKEEEEEEKKPSNPPKPRELPKSTTFKPVVVVVPQVRKGGKQDSEVPAKKKAWGHFGPVDTSALNPHSKEVPEGNPYCLAGLNFAITGRLDSLSREEMIELIDKYGGHVMTGVGKSCNYLIEGVDGGEAKRRTAEERKLPIITEDDVLEMIRTLPAKSASLVKPSRKASAAKKAQDDAANTKLPATASESEDILWVDKYKPTCLREAIFANRGIADRLVRWLEAWKKTGAPPPARPGSRDSMRAVLLSGPPGIGKTTTAILACKEVGLPTVELNASDTRSKNSLRECVEEALGSRSIAAAFGFGQKRVAKETSVLIMDEVDGMSGGDRGGISELIALIKKTRSPIICMCNDRSNTKIRSLATHCIDLKLTPPPADVLSIRLMQIARQEDVPLTMDEARRISAIANFDVRQAIHLLYMTWLSMKSKAGEEGRSSATEVLNAQSKKGGSGKDIDTNPFDVVPRIFAYKGTTIDQKIRFYFSDYSMVPLLVQENYILTKPAGHTAKQHMDDIARAADAISVGDLIDKRIRSGGRWDLLTEHAALSTIVPAHEVQGPLLTGGHGANFPSWLGKYSVTRKNRRVLSELQAHTRVAAGNITHQDMVIDYLPLFYKRLTDPLRDSGEGDSEGIEEVIGFMDAYGLTREDWDSVNELKNGGDDEGQDGISGSVKAAFTRRYNAGAHAITALTPTASSGADIGQSGQQADLEKENEDEYVEEADEEAKEDVFDDKLIAKGKKEGKEKGVLKRKSSNKGRKKKN